MNRDYIIIWRDELNNDKFFQEYAQIKNAIQVNDKLEVVKDHSECTGVQFHTVPERNEIVIDINEDDVDDFQGVVQYDKTINWLFNTKDGMPIGVRFVATEEPDA